MIHKSLARKEPSFGNLINYLNRGGRNDGYTINCWSDGKEPDKVAAEFHQNYVNHLPKRVKGNALYHEILALPNKPGLSTEKQTDILKDIVSVYLQKRAPEQLAYVHIHPDDTDYVHAHLMISANKVGSNKRERLTKAQFSELQKSIEYYKLEHYGGVFPEKIFTKPARERVAHKEYELKKRTGGGLSRNDQIRQSVGKALQVSKTLAEFKQQLHQRGFTLYCRGKTWGVHDLGINKKYRLKTLGLIHAIQQIQRLSELESQQHIEHQVALDLTGFERE